MLVSAVLVTTKEGFAKLMILVQNVAEQTIIV